MKNSIIFCVYHLWPRIAGLATIIAAATITRTQSISAKAVNKEVKAVQPDAFEFRHCQLRGRTAE